MNQPERLCYSTQRPKVHRSHERLEQGIRKSAKIRAATSSIFSLLFSNQHSTQPLPLVNLFHSLTFLCSLACVPGHMTPNGHSYWNKYFLLLVDQHLVTDWSLYLGRGIIPMCPAFIQSAVAKGPRDQDHSSFSMGCGNRFHEQEVQIQQVWLIEVKRKQWTASECPREKKDLKQK